MLCSDAHLDRYPQWRLHCWGASGLMLTTTLSWWAHPSAPRWSRQRLRRRGGRCCTWTRTSTTVASTMPPSRSTKRFSGPSALKKSSRLRMSQVKATVRDFSALLRCSLPEPAGKKLPSPPPPPSPLTTMMATASKVITHTLNRQKGHNGAFSTKVVRSPSRPARTMTKSWCAWLQICVRASVCSIW